MDGDGKFDVNDLLVIWKKKVKPMLAFHLPGAGGFSAGFYLGFSRG